MKAMKATTAMKAKAMPAKYNEGDEGHDGDEGHARQVQRRR